MVHQIFGGGCPKKGKDVEKISVTGYSTFIQNLDGINSIYYRRVESPACFAKGSVYIFLQNTDA